jgi:hypothetical protein
MTVSLVKLNDISNLTNHTRTDLLARCFYTVLGIINIWSNCLILSLLTCFEWNYIWNIFDKNNLIFIIPKITARRCPC